MKPHPDPPPEALAPVDTRVRFSLRGMFIATALAATWLAAVTPWFREWNGEQRMAFALVGFSTALGVGATFVVLRLQRNRAVRRAGALHFRLPLASSRFALFCGVGAALGSLALTMALGFFQAIYPPSRAFGGILIWNFIALENGAVLALAGLGIWWRTTNLEFCDEGMMTGFGILPWEKMRGFRWGASDPHLLVLKCPWTILAARVRAGDKPAIEDFLARRLPMQPS